MSEVPGPHLPRQARAARRRQTVAQRSSPCQYAAQRRLGFAWLNFAEPMEQEFRAGFFAMNVLRIRIAAVLGFFGVSGFVLVDAHAQALLTPRAVDFLLYCCLPSGIAGFALSFARRPTYSVQYLLVICAAMFSLGDVGAIVASRLVRGWFPWESIVLVTLYSFFLGGLLYRQATAVGALVAGAFLLGRQFVPGSSYSIQYEIYYLLMANSIGWIGLYFFEYHQRLSFLLERELGQRALMDGLTGTFNRVAIRKQLNVMWRQAQRDKRAVALMLIDIDHFKEINDRHGHLVGDACLREIGEVLSQCGRRALDAVGRFGGDEFLVAWYDVDAEGLEHLRQMIEERVAKIRCGVAPEVALRISGGAVLAWPAPECRLVDMLQRADTRLYEAKRAGRGRILVEVGERGAPALRLVKSG